MPAPAPAAAAAATHPAVGRTKASAKAHLADVIVLIAISFPPSPGGQPYGTKLPPILGTQPTTRPQPGSLWGRNPRQSALPSPSPEPHYFGGDLYQGERRDAIPEDQPDRYRRRQDTAAPVLRRAG